MVYKKAMSKMWLLRRMKRLKIEPEIILDFYLMEIRTVAEHGVPVWNSALTKGQVKQLEKIQRIALFIILDDKNLSYSQACSRVGLQTLCDRRKDLCLTFAAKLFKGDSRNKFFMPTVRKSRRPALVIENLCRTRRAQNAPHNYLGRILNENHLNLHL